MSRIPRHSPADAHKLITDEGYVHVDVRSEPEYNAGHPAGALNVPLMHAGPGGMSPNPDFLQVMTALFPKDAKLVLGCRSGARSLRAAEMLASAGYTSVVDQRAGFEGPRDPMGRPIEPGWKDAGLPVETATPGGSYAELKQKARG
jgi:rhodanese-related sulfurtransferase